MDNSKRLVEHLEKLRRTLLALESYMAQIRDLIAISQALIDETRGEPGTPKPGRRARRTSSSP